MRSNWIFLALLALIHVNVFGQQYFPGGIDGAEVWYIPNESSVSNGVYDNYGYDFIELQTCESFVGQTDLFNFNPSVRCNNLCLFYNAPLENSTARNVFFVNEPREGYSRSHVTTKWNPELPNIPHQDSLRTRFDWSNESMLLNKFPAPFQLNKNAHINFFHFNHYEKDKRFKSYGYAGETHFYLGKKYDNGVTQAEFFHGNFAEFISFPFELTENEKNRVESYLALKYGITLSDIKDYRNSKNKVFWNKINNNAFGNEIFGIGRDDISGLNQLQSESVHLRDYLIASVGSLEHSNPEKQALTSIPNDHFIVFGNNKAEDGLQPANDFGVQTLNKKWLAQRTGPEAHGLQIDFKHNIHDAIYTAISNHPELRVWMLHDKFVNNVEISDFNSHYVDYYIPSNVSSDYSFFERVRFDPDENLYDQFTFGVGPEMIVQVRFAPGACNGKNVEATAVITGGTPPYDVTITDTGTYNGNFLITGNTQGFVAVASNTYTVAVVDANMVTASTSVDIVIPNMTLDLGPDQVLNASVTQITLDAGVSISDPDATYSWYLNGVLLPQTGPTLTVTEPGDYGVEVVDSSRMCIARDSITISFSISGRAFAISECDVPGEIILELYDATPPFTTVITGGTPTINQVHNATTYTFPNIPHGTYTVTSTDANGSIFQETVNVLDPAGGIELDILAQLQQSCIGYPGFAPFPHDGFICSYPAAILDASALVTNPNVTYQWYVNGALEATTPSVMTYDASNDFLEPVEITVIVTNLSNGCEVSETFYLLKESVKYLEENLIGDRKDESRMANTQTEANLRATVYPNPSESGAAFYYNITSTETFSGEVELYSPTGALLQHQSISGHSSYALPFQLITAGIYMLCVRSEGEVLTNKVIIR